MTTVHFNDPFLKQTVNDFSSSEFEQKPLTSDHQQQLCPKEETEHEVEESLDDGISADDHLAFIESVQKLAETCISCNVGVFETRQDGNGIASVELVKMLSQLFLTGHQVCEDWFNLKWTKDGTKEIEEKIEMYKGLTESIAYKQQQLQEQQLLQEQQAYEEQPMVHLEEDVDKLMEQIKPIIDMKHEPEVIEISDDEKEEEIKLPPAKRPKIIIVRRNQFSLNSVTEGCQSDYNDERAGPSTSALTRLSSAPPPIIRILQTASLTYATGITVGYSDSGKKPILIVADPKLKEIVYPYRCMIQGSYRCTACGLLNVHRYAKLYQGVLYSNLHECKGKSLKSVEQEQKMRAQRFNYAPLPTLLQLSTTEDPRPYPPYPKKRRITRRQNPLEWEDLIEYPNFSACLTTRPGMVGYVAYDNHNPTLCFEYVPSPRGSYRCATCLLFRKHTVAKVDDLRRVLQSAAHVCHGITIDEFEATQAQRPHWNPPTNIIHFDDFDL